MPGLPTNIMLNDTADVANLNARHSVNVIYIILHAQFLFSVIYTITSNLDYSPSVLQDSLNI